MKHTIILISLVLSLTACGRTRVVTATPCTVERETDGSIINCPDGTTSYIANGGAGPQGPVGSTGTQGSPGNGGTNGTSCSVSTVPTNSAAPNGGALITCTDGTSSLVLNGTNGSNATQVQPVQFCPGKSVYPSVFVESGFCINGSIYAVYSSNGGFLTEILPGAWSSDAIGSSCNFTVLSNCQIQN